MSLSLSYIIIIILSLSLLVTASALSVIPAESCSKCSARLRAWYSNSKEHGRTKSHRVWVFFKEKDTESMDRGLLARNMGADVLHRRMTMKSPTQTSNLSDLVSVSVLIIVSPHNH